MIELAFDIASGANYKFNTAFLGEQVRGHGTPERKVPANKAIL